MIETMTFTEAFLEGWSFSATFVGMLAGMILPWLPVALLCVLVWRLVQRSRRSCLEETEEDRRHHL